MSLEWTGERVIEGKSPENVMRLHQARYRACIQSGVIDGARVIDVPCGSGYGTFMMDAKAEMVMGVDNDAATIAHCCNEVDFSSGVYFQHRDMVTDMWFFRDEMFDVAVCFEGLEHVDKADGERVLRELARVTSKYLFLSTPNKATSLSDNKYHKHEYTRAELVDLMESCGWVVVDICGQWRKGRPDVVPVPDLMQPDFFYVVLKFGQSRVYPATLFKGFSKIVLFLFWEKLE